MVGDRAKRAQEIFRRALDAEPGERTQVVFAACAGDESLAADVNRLLRALTRSTGFLEGAAIASVPLTPARMPETVGSYRVLRMLGSGGMASVYEAEQRTPARRVALKVLHPGLAHTSAGRRLRFEADVLARLRHPGIAQIYEVSSTPDGSPFIAMEFIDGARPITDFARFANLDLRARLTMFADVCDAVQHGHQVGVIHRDLKPANILVGADARPKVIDFGIARSAGADAERITLAGERGQIIGTLTSMSPEQCAGEGLIDTRTDVYSLGVVLYELVTGRTPIDVSDKPLLEALRSIQRDRPAPPGTIIARLAPELDAVILKALEKDPRDRYPTASELAADVRRFLDDRPVLARPATTIEQVRKFARRNRALVAGSTAVVVLLAAAAIVTGRMAYVTRRALDETRVRTAELEDVLAFQQAQLQNVNVPGMGNDIRAAILSATPEADRPALERALADVNFTTVALGALDQRVLQRSRTAIDSQFAASPLVRARLLLTLASTMKMLGLKNEAMAPLSDALAIRRAQLGDEHEDTLVCMTAMGELSASLGRLDEALGYASAAYETRKRLLGPDHPDTLTSASTLGGVYDDRGEFDLARRYWAEALEGRRRVLGDDARETLISLNNMGLVCAVLGDLDGAESAWREVADRRRRKFGPDSPEYRTSLSNLGLLLHERGKLAEARPMLEDALASLRRELGDAHPSTLTTMASVADLRADMGELDSAYMLLQECLETRRRVLGPEHAATLRSTLLLAALMQKRGNPELAFEMATAAVDVQRRRLGAKHPDTVEGIGGLSSFALAAHKLDLAESLAREAMTLARQTTPPGHRDLARHLVRFGQMLVALERFDEAEPALLEAHSIVQARPSENDPILRQCRETLAEMYEAWHARSPGSGHDAAALRWKAGAQQR
jgi:tetratricopeptide (TPR) repeat protein/tRNA A-37 threonylcarbamoyl transferase component Bud32